MYSGRNGSGKLWESFTTGSSLGPVEGLAFHGSAGEIDLLASRGAILQKLHTRYLDPVAAAEAPDVPRRALVTRDDATTTTALVFGMLISIGSLGAALPVLASGGAV